MSTFSASEKTIGGFFSNLKDNKEKSLSIPDLQRDFTWSDEQFQEFWDDLNSKYDNTFFGSILVKDQNNSFLDVEIIDGQQRITTISIFVQTICLFLENLKFSAFYEPNPHQLYTKIEELQKLFIDRYEVITLPGGRSTVENNYYLNVQDSVLEYFRKYVQTPLDPAVYHELTTKRPYREMIKEFLDISSSMPAHRPHFNKGRSCKRMQEAYNFFKEKIEESEEYLNLNPDNDDELKHQKFVGYLDGLITKLKNFQIVHIQSPGEELAYEYFEAVNARGVNLSVSDLLKNLILKNISNSTKLSEAKSTWDKFIENIRDFDKRNNAIGDFFRYYWASEYEYVASKHLYKAIKQKKIQELGDDDDKWLQYTKELYSTSETYRLLLDTDKNKADFVSFGFSEGVAKSLFDSIYGLRASKSRLWTVIYLSLINKNPNRDNFSYFTGADIDFNYAKFTDTLSRFIFCYSYIVKDRSNRVWTTFSNLSKKLNEASKENKNKEELKEIFKEYYYKKINVMIPSEELFRQECVDNLVYLKSFTHPVKYALWEIEKNIYDNKDFSRGNTTIEHIVPRKPKEHWGFELEQCKEIDTIGNLILMEKRPNSRLRNYNLLKKVDKLIERPSDIRQVIGSDDQSIKGFIKYNGNPPETADIHFPNFENVKLVSGIVNIEPIKEREEFVLNQLYTVFVLQVKDKILGHL